jgi:TonB family protein
MRSIIAALITLALAYPLVAQTAEVDILARLLKKPLYLRGQWHDDKLAFDDAGHLIGTSAPVVFTLAGIDIRSAKLTPNSLVIVGQRVGLEFKKDVPNRLGLLEKDRGATRPELITMEIQRPANGDFTAALDSIFTPNMADSFTRLPEYWKVSTGATGANAQPPVPPKAAPTGPISPPRILQTDDPEYNRVAQALNYSGKVVLSLQVDETGRPTYIGILHPIGLGLDEEAISAASKYLFKPAMQNKNPIAYQLILEINFERY